MEGNSNNVSRQINRGTVKVNLQLTKILYTIMIILPLYQDSPLQKYFGSAGESLMPTISIIIGTLFLMTTGKITTNKSIKSFFKLFAIWLPLVSLFAIAVHLMSGGSMILYGENVFVKSIKNIIKYVAYAMYLSVMIRLMRKLSFEQIMKPIALALFLIVIICGIELTQIPYAFKGLHYAGTFPYWRVRLLSMESSTTTGSIFMYSGLTIYYSLVKKNYLLLGLAFVSCLFLFATTGSKTLLAAIGIVLCIYLVLSFRKINKKTMFGIMVAVVGLFFAYFTVLQKFQNSLLGDIQNYTSFATRFYSIIIGVMIGLIIPCGVGASIYLSVYPTALAKYMTWFQSKFPNLSMTEILNLINGQSDTALTVKSGLIQGHMLWGIIGSIYIMRVFISMHKQVRKRNIPLDNLLLALFWTFIALLIFAQEFGYEFWFLVAIVLWMIERYKMR